MKIEDAAKRFFGTTLDFNKAGFILEDGTLLDLSGAHLGNANTNKRTLMHFSFFGTNTHGFSLESLFEYFPFFYEKYPLLQFIDKASACRCRCNDYYIYAEYTKVPNIAQIKIIKDIFDKYSKKAFIFDLVSISGYVIDSIEYTSIFSIESVINWAEKTIKKQPSNVLVESSINLYAKHVTPNY